MAAVAEDNLLLGGLDADRENYLKLKLNADHSFELRYHNATFGGCGDILYPIRSDCYLRGSYTVQHNSWTLTLDQASRELVAKAQAHQPEVLHLHINGDGKYSMDEVMILTYSDEVSNDTERVISSTGGSVQLWGLFRLTDGVIEQVSH
eukprot:TRINITY_DN2738_c0_g3_i2.p1 TRINITY_DN2738_c0_g3~~TRINITY_DN2738_c0_g3_i2.p1  ORF type:complete len:149 (+),score=14.49 TRINITY_DN2738_c0_g3_i2:78-524(+)